MEIGEENQSQDLERENDLSMPEILGNSYMTDIHRTISREHWPPCNLWKPQVHSLDWEWWSHGPLERQGGYLQYLSERLGADGKKRVIFWLPFCKIWCFRTVVLQETLNSPLDNKEIKPVNPKLNQPWIFFGRTDAEAEAPLVWPPDVMSWLVRKDSDAGKDWGQEKKGVTKDEMVGWHHWLSGHEFEQTAGDSEGRGSLACFSPWGCKESDTT